MIKEEREFWDRVKYEELMVIKTIEGGNSCDYEYEMIGSQLEGECGCECVIIEEDKGLYCIQSYCGLLVDEYMVVVS